MTWQGTTVSHAKFFESFQSRDRVAIYAPRGLDGLGAAALIMAFVTAFYDRYRAEGSEAIAYPEFFTFQRVMPCVDYAMLDIWPYHRNLYFDNDAQLLRAIADRDISVLLIPQGCDLDIENSGARDCYEYAADGDLHHHDLAVEIDSDLLKVYMQAVIASARGEQFEAVRESWSMYLQGDELRQLFRKLPLSAAAIVD